MTSDQDLFERAVITSALRELIHIGQAVSIEPVDKESAREFANRIIVALQNQISARQREIEDRSQLCKIVNSLARVPILNLWSSSNDNNS